MRSRGPASTAMRKARRLRWALALVAVATLGCGRNYVAPSFTWSAEIDGRAAVLEGGAIDLGVVEPHVPVSVRRSGACQSEPPVSFVRISTSCGCVHGRVEIAGDDQRAANQVTAHITVNAIGYPNGPFLQRFFLIFEHDGRELVQAFAIAAVVHSRFKVDLAPLPLGSVLAGQAVAAERVLVGEGVPWAVSDVDWLPPGSGPGRLRHELLGSSPDGQRTLRLEFTAPSSGGAHQDSLLVRTTHPDMPRFVLTVDYKVAGGVELVPPRAPLGRCRRGSAGEWFEVLVVGATAVKVNGATAGQVPGAECLEFAVDPASARGSVVRVRYSGRVCPAKTVAATIRLEVAPGMRA